MDGQAISQISQRNTAYIVAKWVLSSQVQIAHNGYTRTTEPDRHHKWYMQHVISRAADNLEPGTNIYTIILSDNRWQELCRTSVSLEAR
jgi:hypothetical protein